eukprot:m.29126 g.29126  ORF g.29126 m.29126 type:complete len:603 (+) comp8066_c0_seq1:254-2062(+)
MEVGATMGQLCITTLLYVLVVTVISVSAQDSTTSAVSTTTETASVNKFKDFLGTTIVASIFAGVSIIGIILLLGPSAFALERRHRQDVPESFLARVLYRVGSYISLFLMDAAAAVFMMLALKDGDPNSETYQDMYYGVMLFTLVRTIILFSILSREDAQSRETSSIRVGFLSLLNIVVLAILILVVVDYYENDKKVDSTSRLVVLCVYIVGATSLASESFGAAMRCKHPDGGSGLARLFIGKASGYYLIFIGSLLHALSGIVYTSIDEDCAKEDFNCGDCLFKGDLDHTFWRFFIDIFGTIIIIIGLLRKKGSPHKPNPSFTGTISPQGSIRPTPYLPPPDITTPDAYNLDPGTDYKPPNNNLISPNDPPHDDFVSPNTSAGKKETKREKPTLNNSSYAGVSIDDRILKKMYDLFTKADSEADAGLTEEEFVQSVEVDKLREILEPVGGLNVKHLAKARGITDIPEMIDAKVLFWILDRDDNKHITMKEFLGLIEQKLESGKTVLQGDAALKKLHDMFINMGGNSSQPLSKEEFMLKIDIGDLKKTLQKMQVLDLEWLTPKGRRASQMVTPESLFQMLDANGDNFITIGEFVKLVESQAQFM